MITTLPLSPQVFAILGALIEERTGLHYGMGERELLADRVSARALENGFETLLDYYYFLRYDARAESEIPLLAEALVVNETYFFRETAALRMVVEHVVPEVLGRGSRPKIWCAACSTGEEPLTLAMMLDEVKLLEQVTLTASDISRRVLEHAKLGTYRRRSLRSLPPGVVGRWLHGDDAGMQVASHIARAVNWQHVNLTDERRLTDLGQFDAILCRNVLIYFKDETIERVVRSLWRRLLPGGLLFVGASESLMRLDVPFECEERGGIFFYRKVDR